MQLFLLFRMPHFVHFAAIKLSHLKNNKHSWSKGGIFLLGVFMEPMEGQNLSGFAQHMELFGRPRTVLTLGCDGMHKLCHRPESKNTGSVINKDVLIASSVPQWDMQPFAPGH